MTTNRPGSQSGRGPRIASDLPGAAGAFGGSVPSVSSVSPNEVLVMTRQGVVDLPVGAGVVLVVGGTGKTGRRVAERLAGLGYGVRVGSRSGAVAFDWHDEGTWEAALEGVSAAYLTYYPDLAFPGAVEAV
ncbi:hypothetical protein ACFWNL_13155, partial [Kitasatospora sp. NPDC058397]